MRGKLILATLAWAAIAAAQPDPPPFNSHTVEDRNMLLKVEIGLGAPFGPVPVTEPENPILVSGTIVNVTFEAGAAGIPDWSGPAWTGYEILHVVAEVSGVDGATAVSEDNLREYSVPNAGVGSQIARFASTAFDHGWTINLTVRACWRLSRDGEPPKIVDVEHTVPVQAHNVAVPWATKEIESGGGFTVPSPEQYYHVSSTARRAMHLLLRPAPYGQLMTVNHQVSPATADDSREQQESELQVLLQPGTLFVTMTHGHYGESSTLGLRSSYDDGDPATGDDLLTWTEIGTYVGTSVPLPNLALIWACTSAVDLAIGAASFKVDGCPDAAYAGFPGRVHVRLHSSSTPGSTPPALDRHTDSVMTGLRGGKRLDQALQHANNNWTPGLYEVEGEPPVTELLMTVPANCDEYTRLINVYYSKQERQANPQIVSELKDKWIWFLPLPQ